MNSENNTPNGSDKDPDEKRNSFKQIGAFVTIPFALAVPPIIGWLIGSWLDSTFGMSPYLMFTFLLFGFIAGCREVYRIIKRFGDDL